MRLINNVIHESVESVENKRVFNRVAGRAIILKKNEILMIYTKRYDDYSFPGGGIDSGEDIVKGLVREIREETGATGINVISHFGDYEEIRPIHYDDYDLMNMISHYYICDSDSELGENNPEKYEIENGSEPVWVDINDAIAHNTKVIAKNAATTGYSIKRETEVLQLIKKELA